MPTTKKRINITVDDSTYESLEKLTEIHGESLAGVSLRLLLIAMDLEEDLHFSKISEKRLQVKQKRLSHRQVWD